MQSKTLEARIGEGDKAHTEVFAYVEAGQIEKGTQTIIGLNGFSYPAEFYSELISNLSERYRVFFPSISGMNHFKEPPRTIAQSVEYAWSFTEALKENEGIKKYHLIGHSLGATIAAELASIDPDASDLVMINPVLPASFGRAGIIYRTMKKWLLEAYEKHGGEAAGQFALNIIPSCTLNFLQAPLASWELVGDILRYEYKRGMVSQPTYIMYGKDDELFSLDNGIKRQLAASFPDMYYKNVQALKERNHDWPLFYPGQASSLITGFYLAQDKKKAQQQLNPEPMTNL